MTSQLYVKLKPTSIKTCKTSRLGTCLQTFHEIIEHKKFIKSWKLLASSEKMQEFQAFLTVQQGIPTPLSDPKVINGTLGHESTPEYLKFEFFFN